MTRDQPSDAAEADHGLTRRRLLLSSGAVGLATLVAGCGGGGAGLNTTVSPTETGMVTESPTPGSEPTETAMETATDAETETATATDTGGEAMVRAAHLSPNAPNVDVLVDGSVVLEDVPFGVVSEYLVLAAGPHTVEITAAGDPETVVFEGEVTLEAGTEYTVAAIGEVGDDADQPFGPLVLTDDNEPPGSGTARLRAVHASPDAPAVDITAGETVLFDNLSYGEAATGEVPAGDYTVEIRPETADDDGEVVASFDVSLAGEQVYTAFAAGYLSPDDEPAETPFDLIVTQDSGG